MSLLPKSIHRCRRYPTKFNSGRDIPRLRIDHQMKFSLQPAATVLSPLAVNVHFQTGAIHQDMKRFAGAPMDYLHTEALRSTRQRGVVGYP